MLRCIVVFAAFLGLILARPAAAEDISVQIDAAKAAHARGDALKAMSLLQAAAAQIGTRLSEQLGRMTPPPLPGWETQPPEYQSLDMLGGGLTVTRAYVKGGATLNAALIVDNPAVGGVDAMFVAMRQGPQPGWSRVRVNGEDALLRFDAESRSGEILIVERGRMLLQIEGNEIADGEVLVEAAKGWNTGALKKLIGG